MQSLPFGQEELAWRVRARAPQCLLEQRAAFEVAPV